MKFLFDPASPLLEFIVWNWLDEGGTGLLLLFIGLLPLLLLLSIFRLRFRSLVALPPTFGSVALVPLLELFEWLLWLMLLLFIFIALLLLLTDWLMLLYGWGWMFVVAELLVVRLKFFSGVLLWNDWIVSRTK